MAFIAFGGEGAGRLCFLFNKEAESRGRSRGHEEVPWLGYDTWEALKGS